MKTANDLVLEANTQVATLTAADAVKFAADHNVVFIDLREPAEVERGTFPGAVHVPRGLLEFQVDPQSPSHNPKLAADKQFILFCASGGRSALAAKALKDMGITNVAHVAGGFPALLQAKEG
jgi:rhodanese-related sulfurtransferase